jgi:hypothetical protein
MLPPITRVGSESSTVRALIASRPLAMPWRRRCGGSGLERWRSLAGRGGGSNVRSSNDGYTWKPSLPRAALITSTQREPPLLARAISGIRAGCQRAGQQGDETEESTDFRNPKSPSLLKKGWLLCRASLQAGSLILRRSRRLQPKAAPARIMGRGPGTGVLLGAKTSVLVDDPSGSTLEQSGGEPSA